MGWVKTNNEYRTIEPQKDEVEHFQILARRSSKSAGGPLRRSPEGTQAGAKGPDKEE